MGTPFANAIEHSVQIPVSELETLIRQLFSERTPRQSEDLRAAVFEAYAAAMILQSRMHRVTMLWDYNE